MINIDSFRQFLFYVANKSQSGTSLSPDEFNIIVPRAYQRWVYDRYGNSKMYQQGRPLPTRSIDLTQGNIDDLRFLKENEIFPLTDGKMALPNGTTVTNRANVVVPEYMHATALKTIFSVQTGKTVTDVERTVKVLRDDELTDRLSSQLLPPATKHPVANFENDSIQFYPKTIQFVEISYLRQPPPPVWAFTTVNGRPVYDAANSTNIEAPEEAENEIAMAALSFMGIHAREAELFQYAEQMQAQGI